MAETWAKVAAMPPKLPPRLPKVASIPAWHCHLQRGAQCRRQGCGARHRFLLLRQVLAPSRWLLPQQRHQQIKRSSADGLGTSGNCMLIPKLRDRNHLPQILLLLLAASAAERPIRQHRSISILDCLHFFCYSYTCILAGKAYFICWRLEINKPGSAISCPKAHS